MDTATFARMFPKSQPGPDVWAAALTPALAAGEINSPRRMAAWFGVTGHETGGYSVLSENLNYSVEGLISGFGRHRISIADAERLGRRPGRPADQEGIANALYGGEWGRINLGNVRPGDGWKFRGGGCIQVTGRANFQRLADALGMSLDALLLEIRKPEGSAMASALWWKQAGCNALADRPGELISEALCRKVNGGLKGLTERREIAARVLPILSGSASASAPVMPVAVSRSPVVGSRAAVTESEADRLNGIQLARLGVKKLD